MPAKPDGTSCDDGDPCSTGDSCSAGSCQGVIADEDNDGVCDVLDVCPQISDPDQPDANGNGVGDSCECTAPAPGRCLVGGGNKRTDCLVEFNTTGPVTMNRKRTGLLGVLRCADGDAACDRDGTADGTCTFGVALCLGNNDPRLPLCQPADVLNFEVMSPSPERSKLAGDRTNGLELEKALGSLGLEIRRRGRTLSAAAAPAGPDLCSPLVNLTVPAPAAAGGKPVRRKFRMRAGASDGRRDDDVVVLQCSR
jgi:hypothetical protein